MGMERGNVSFGHPGRLQTSARRGGGGPAARRHGKTCAMLVATAEQARQWKEAGVLLLAYSSEIEVLHQGFTQALARIRAGA
jgi:hypothetical protein